MCVPSLSFQIRVLGFHIKLCLNALTCLPKLTLTICEETHTARQFQLAIHSRQSNGLGLLPIGEKHAKTLQNLSKAMLNIIIDTWKKNKILMFQTKGTPYNTFFKISITRKKNFFFTYNFQIHLPTAGFSHLRVRQTCGWFYAFFSNFFHAFPATPTVMTYTKTINLRPLSFPYWCGTFLYGNQNQSYNVVEKGVKKGVNQIFLVEGVKIEVWHMS